jgi:hypothetical protein
MEKLATYRNKLAQLKPGQKRFASAAAHQAAEERILARKVEPGEVLRASNGQLIPEGHYAIVEADEEGPTVITADPAFFDTIWELAPPNN